MYYITCTCDITGFCPYSDGDCRRCYGYEIESEEEESEDLESEGEDYSRE